MRRKLAYDRNEPGSVPEEMAARRQEEQRKKAHEEWIESEAEKFVPGHERLPKHIGMGRDAGNNLSENDYEYAPNPALDQMDEPAAAEVTEQIPEAANTIPAQTFEDVFSKHHLDQLDDQQKELMRMR